MHLNQTGKSIGLIVIIAVVAVVVVLTAIMLMNERDVNKTVTLARQSITEGQALEGQKAYTDAFAKYDGARKACDAALLKHKNNRALSGVRAEADNAVQQMIAKLMLDGNRYLQAGNFREPPKENAWDCYAAILTMDPNNAEAKQGQANVEAAEKGVTDFWNEQKAIEKTNQLIVQQQGDNISEKDRTVMESFIQSYQIRIQRILERERRNAEIHGRLKIRLEVEKNGKISDMKLAPVGQSTFPPKVLDQIKSELRTWKITGLSKAVEYEFQVNFVD